MALRRRSGGGWVDVSNVRRRQGNGWVNVEFVRRRQGGAWITVFSSYTAPSVSVSPSYVLGTSSGTGPTGTVNTARTTASVSGGTGNYTFAWERISGNTNATATSPASPDTAFRCTGVSGFTNAQFRLRVSDGVTTVYSAVVLAEFQYTRGGGGVPL